MERMREQGSPTRRDIVASAAAGAGALLAGKLAWAEAARSPGRVDLHHQYSPPAFLDAQRRAASRQSRPAALGAALEGWSKARTIEAMDRYGIAIGILSISTPGPWLGNIEFAAHRRARRGAGRHRDVRQGEAGGLVAVGVDARHQHVVPILECDRQCLADDALVDVGAKVEAGFSLGPFAIASPGMAGLSFTEGTSVPSAMRG
jgi:hypothetical protein